MSSYYQGTSVYIVNDLYKQPVSIARIMCTSVNLVIAIDAPHRPDPPKGPKSTPISPNIDSHPSEFFVPPKPHPGLDHPGSGSGSPPMTPNTTPNIRSLESEPTDTISQWINIFEKATSDRLTVSTTYPYIFKKDPDIFKNEKILDKNPMKNKKMKNLIHKNMNKVSYLRLKTEISLNIEQYNYNLLTWESIVDPFAMFISCTAPIHHTTGTSAYFFI